MLIRCVVVYLSGTDSETATYGPNSPYEVGLPLRGLSFGLESDRVT